MKSPKDMRIIQIDITNACMYQCSNCTRFCGHHKKNFFMDFETFKRAVDSMKGYHGTVGVMGGEPTLHPQFERFVLYLQSQIPNEYKKNHRALLAPQKDFIQAILMENKNNSEVYTYETGDRETVVGAGLWSAMVPTYKKHYELIQDVFKMQAVNDHGNVMYHSPILINRKDLGIKDDEWHTIREHCWAQDIWSATITPKGAFFCEIAGALDMLFDGPGGWPIEEGWWRRTPDEFGDQIKWCEYCGIALETFTRNANDWVDDVSESMYKKLLEIDSPKLKREGAINLVKIEDGIIAEESKKGVLEIRKELFYDNFSSRFNEERCILYPEEFEIIIDIENLKEIELNKWLEKYEMYFQHIYVLSDKLLDVHNSKIVFAEHQDPWGRGFSKAFRQCKDQVPIIYMNAFNELDQEFLEELKVSVLNPGTLMMNEEAGRITALFFKNASSLKKVGLDSLSNSLSMLQIKDMWESSKIIAFDIDEIVDASILRIQTGKKYVVYGAGETGKIAYKDIYEVGSEVVMFVDSDCNKWGEKMFDKEICNPQSLVEDREKYDLIVIASTYYQDIKNTILHMGLTEQDYIVHE